MHSICSILFLLISILTSSYGQVTCQVGTPYGESCYVFIFNSRTWDQCNTFCSTYYPGATMLCVNNAAENEWIRSQLGGAWFWIGYTDMLPYEGGKGTKQFGWITGCSSTYTNWQAGEPSNQDYAVLYPHSSGPWYVSQQHLSFCGCEYTPAPTTTPSFHPSVFPSSGLQVAPSSRPTVAPSSGPTSSPNATPSFSSSEGYVSE
jgi:hypothetical protein